MGSVEQGHRPRIKHATGPAAEARAYRNLDASFYADPEIYRQEREKIFQRYWQPIASAESLAAPGAYLAATVAGYQVFVRRGGDGTLRAFHNVCPHRGAQLLPNGGGACEQLRCPYHGWRFGADGRLEDAPWFGETSPFEIDALGLAPIGVAEWRGLVFVAIAPQVELIEQLGDLPENAAVAPMENFALHATRSFDAAVNWKAYLDQFVEFYHAPIVHAPDKSVGIEHYDAYPQHGMMVMTAPRGEAADAAYYGGTWLWGWPNWTVSFFPGGMKTSRVDPLSATSCRIEFGFYFANTSAMNATQRDQVVSATECIFREDVDAAARVQVNYTSGAYSPGPLHPRLERAVAYFQARVRHALDDTAADPNLVLVGAGPRQ